MPNVTIVKAKDDFESSAAGWIMTDDKGDHAVTYSQTGGHPGGMVSAVDNADHTWFFTAPAKYTGDASKLYGGVLRFDLKVTEITDGFNWNDVMIYSGDVVIVYDCSPDPSTAWTSYEVPLVEGNWKIGSLQGLAASKEQLKQVLANITRLQIRGEYNTGSDTGMLDNVYFGTK